MNSQPSTPVQSAFDVLLRTKGPTAVGQKRPRAGTSSLCDAGAASTPRNDIAPLFQRSASRQLICIRHGHTLGYHAVDTGLSEEGRSQAASLLHTVPSVADVDAIICSPLTRAMLTCCIAFAAHKHVELSSRSASAGATGYAEEPGASAHSNRRRLPIFVTPLVAERLATVGDVGRPPSILKQIEEILPLHGSLSGLHETWWRHSQHKSSRQHITASRALPGVAAVKFAGCGTTAERRTANAASSSSAAATANDSDIIDISGDADDGEDDEIAAVEVADADEVTATGWRAPKSLKAEIAECPASSPSASPNAPLLMECPASTAHGPGSSSAAASSASAGSSSSSGASASPSSSVGASRSPASASSTVIPPSYRFPPGESPESKESLRYRVAAFRDYIRALPPQYKKIAIFGHAVFFQEFTGSSKRLRFCEAQVITLR